MNGSESSRTANVVPALALAAVAGAAFTYFLMKHKGRDAAPSAIENIIQLCSNAADKLDATAASAMAS